MYCKSDFKIYVFRCDLNLTGPAIKLIEAKVNPNKASCKLGSPPLILAAEKVNILYVLNIMMVYSDSIQTFHNLFVSGQPWDIIKIDKSPRYRSERNRPSNQYDCFAQSSFTNEQI